MKNALRALVCCVLCLAPGATFAQDALARNSRAEIEAIIADYLKNHPDDLGRIVLDYVAQHPESLRDLLVALAKKRSGAAPSATSGAAVQAAQKLAQERAAAIAASADALFRSPHQVELGDSAGDVTLVEFFDYNCGYCKRALGDTEALLASDPKLKIVLKEFPVLGPRSVEAAKVDVAVRMQDPAGQTAKTFHFSLLGSRGPVGAEQALAAAQGLGLDRARLERDMESDESRATLEESARLAAVLHINGTPAYVIGDKALVGAVGLDTLKAQIAALREHNKP